MARTDPFAFVEAGPANLAFTHVRAAPERRPAAPGPAGAGDIRSQRGAGALAVLAQTPAADQALAATAAAPGLTGDTGGAQASSVAPAVGGVGVHFVGGAPTQGLQSSQSPAGAPAGFASTSGPALTYGGNTFAGGYSPLGSAPPNAGAAQPLGGGGSSTGIGRI